VTVGDEKCASCRAVLPSAPATKPRSSAYRVVKFGLLSIFGGIVILGLLGQLAEKAAIASAQQTSSPDSTPPTDQAQKPAEEPAEWEVIPSFSATPDLNHPSLIEGVTWDDALPSLELGTRIEMQRITGDMFMEIRRFPAGGGCLSKVVGITFRRPSEPEQGPYRITRIACKLR
jgi:hypothetical protein